MENPNFRKVIEEVKKIVKKKFKDRAHDYSHTQRVLNIALRIAKGYKNVDRNVIILSALLHDIAREEEDKDKTGDVDHAVLGAEIAQRILTKLGCNKRLIKKVVECVNTHRFKTKKKPRSLEAKIIFDADKIDVLGAIGIARSFMIAGKYGQNVWEIKFNLREYIKSNVSESGRIIDITKHNPYKEFLIKFEKIPKVLYTKEGRMLAVRRLKFMKRFFNEFKKEIDGKV